MKGTPTSLKFGITLLVHQHEWRQTSGVVGEGLIVCQSDAEALRRRHRREGVAVAICLQSLCKLRGNQKSEATDLVP
jgi:hypothetical protein